MHHSEGLAMPGVWNEYRWLRPYAITPPMPPIENAPLLFFHGSVFLLLFFLLSLLFFSFLFLLVIYVHSRVSCSVVRGVHFFFSGLYSHKNGRETSIWHMAALDSVHLCDTLHAMSAHEAQFDKVLKNEILDNCMASLIGHSQTEHFTSQQTSKPLLTAALEKWGVIDGAMIAWHLCRARHWCFPHCLGQVEFVNYSCGASENYILLVPLGKYILFISG